MRRSLLLLALSSCLIAVDATMAAVPALAGDSIPYPPDCTVPSALVGNLSGQPVDGGFVVVVRKLGAPIPNAVVQIVFPAAGARPLAVQEAGTSVDCARGTLSRMADATGTAVFHPRFAGSSGASTIDVLANGVRLAQVPARSTDLDGNGAVDLADFQLFAANFLRAPGATETDYDRSGRTDARDFEIFRRDFIAHPQGSFCP